jgi:riboflavin kinase/FMN adenylyltransferase
VSRAQRLLAKPYAIQGTVVRGDQRGRTLGFPTANIHPDASYVAPATGVYAVTVRALTKPSTLYFGVMNVGHRPTFQGTTLSWEVHLLDYDGDLYDQTLEISFFLRLRDEKSFSSVAQLVQCIHQDISHARNFFMQFS